MNEFIKRLQLAKGENLPDVLLEELCASHLKVLQSLLEANQKQDYKGISAKEWLNEKNGHLVDDPEVAELFKWRYLIWDDDEHEAFSLSEYAKENLCEAMKRLVELNNKEWEQQQFKTFFGENSET